MYFSLYHFILIYIYKHEINKIKNSFLKIAFITIIYFQKKIIY